MRKSKATRSTESVWNPSAGVSSMLSGCDSSRFWFSFNLGEYFGEYLLSLDAYLFEYLLFPPTYFS